MSTANRKVLSSKKNLCWRKKITLNVNNKLRILALNKPEGFECTRSEKSPKKKIFDLLPPEKNFRWISVGRLDLNTSGLLLLTNNGQVANQLMHPSSMLD
ncbi:MAG: pseudouridine synthase, partial [Gammaproteobacteria bacterium]